MITQADIEGAAAELRSLAVVARRETDDPVSALVHLARLCEPLDWLEQTGNNDNPRIQAVLRENRRYPWCAALVAHLADLVGLDLEMLGGFWRARSVDNIARASMRAGCWMGHALTPRPGDLRIYRQRAGSDIAYGPAARKQFGHIGIVVDVQEVVGGPAQVVTLEGNYGNDYRRRIGVVGDPNTGGYHRWPT